MRREGRGGLSGNVAEEAFCLKSAPGVIYIHRVFKLSPSVPACFDSTSHDSCTHGHWMCPLCFRCCAKLL